MSICYNDYNMLEVCLDYNDVAPILNFLLDPPLIQHKPENEAEGGKGVPPPSNPEATQPTNNSNKKKKKKNRGGGQQQQQHVSLLSPEQRKQALNVCDNEGKTPLMLASYHMFDHGVNYTMMMDELLQDCQVEPDLSITDRRDWTVFEHCPMVLECQTDYSGKHIYIDTSSSLSCENAQESHY